MNVITRGVRNAFRNNIRSGSIVLILGFSIGLALAMVVARASVVEKINTVKSSVGNTVTISPAGARGFEGGGEPLTSESIQKIAAVNRVSSVIQTLSDRLTTSNTNLVSAVDAGSLGNRQAGNNGVGFSGGQAPPDGGQSQNQSASQSTRTFTPPVTISGTNVLNASSYGGSTVSYSSGQALDTTADTDEAVVGKSLAEKNSLQVGSTFQAYGKNIKVVGIYDAGNTFANNGVITSLSTLQRISSQSGSVTSATAIIDSIDNIESATKDISSALGSSADVVNNQETSKQAVEPLESVKSISTFSLIGAVGAGAIIILLTMMMVVRERRREIGVYKAIGASNITIVSQFIVEAIALTTVATIAGLIIGIAAATPVTKALVSSNSSQSQQQGPMGGGPRGGSTRNVTATARNVQATVGPETFAYGFSAALVIAIVGSALPAILISKVRPAEVMRTE